ncbi:MAG: hypothetical protein VB041_05500, partial [Candidatus Limiplasma sp.]|nr:hypothetical protein [Candidatus Limiplasma sp.]
AGLGVEPQTPRRSAREQASEQPEGLCGERQPHNATWTYPRHPPPMQRSPHNRFSIKNAAPSRLGLCAAQGRPAKHTLCFCEASRLPVQTAVGQGRWP